MAKTNPFCAHLVGGDITVMIDGVEQVRPVHEWLQIAGAVRAAALSLTRCSTCALRSPCPLQGGEPKNPDGLCGEYRPDQPTAAILAGTPS